LPLGRGSALTDQTRTPTKSWVWRKNRSTRGKMSSKKETKPSGQGKLKRSLPSAEHKRTGFLARLIWGMGKIESLKKKKSNRKPNKAMFAGRSGVTLPMTQKSAERDSGKSRARKKKRCLEGRGGQEESSRSAKIEKRTHTFEGATNYNQYRREKARQGEGNAQRKEGTANKPSKHLTNQRGSGKAKASLWTKEKKDRRKAQGNPGWGGGCKGHGLLKGRGGHKRGGPSKKKVPWFVLALSKERAEKIRLARDAERERRNTRKAPKEGNLSSGES